MQLYKIDSNDLKHILNSLNFIIDELVNKKIFITGGTGFIGKWFLEYILFINNTLNLNLRVTILTRNPNKFKMKYSHIADSKEFKLFCGDITNFYFFPESFDFIIHLATPSEKDHPLNLFETSIDGVKRVLDFAIVANVKKILFISSGAVYGRKNILNKLSEESSSIIWINDNVRIEYVAYGLAKRVGEFLCYEYSRQYGFETKIARCFTFVGPYLPLDKNYVIGNFIRDAMNGGPIVVKGDGTAVRSYMYASDLMIWLWTILFKGKNCEPYNVGSEEEITIKELAFKVAEIYKKLTGKTVEVIIQGEPNPTKPVDRYVPSTKKAKTELGLKQTVSLDEAIEKTFKFYYYYLKDLRKN